MLPLSFEFFPPKTPEGVEKLRAARSFSLPSGVLGGKNSRLMGSINGSWLGRGGRIRGCRRRP